MNAVYKLQVYPSHFVNTHTHTRSRTESQSNYAEWETHMSEYGI